MNGATFCNYVTSDTRCRAGTCTGTKLGVCEVRSMPCPPLQFLPALQRYKLGGSTFKQLDRSTCLCLQVL